MNDLKKSLNMSSIQQRNKKTNKQSIQENNISLKFLQKSHYMDKTKNILKAFMWFVTPIVFVTTNFTYKTKFALSIGKFSIVIGSLRGAPCYVIGLSSRGWPITIIQL